MRSKLLIMHDYSDKLASLTGQQWLGITNADARRSAIGRPPKIENALYGSSAHQ